MGNKGKRCLPLCATCQGLHEQACLPLESRLIIQEALLHLVEELRVLHAHMQQLTLQGPDSCQLLQLQLLHGVRWGGGAPIRAPVGSVPTPLDPARSAGARALAL